MSMALRSWTGAGTNICFLEDDAYEKFDALPEQYTKSGYRAEMLHGITTACIIER